MDPEQLKLAAELIRQAPPGQVGDVLADIQAIIGDEPAFKSLALEQVAEYNLDQLTTVTLPTASEPTILSRAARLPGRDDAFVDPETRLSFTYDHETGQPSNEEGYALPEEEEAFRAALSKSLKAYVKNHYPAGACAVFCSARPLRKAQDASTNASQPAGEQEIPSAIDAPTEDAEDASKSDDVSTEAEQDASKRDGVAVEEEKVDACGKETEPIETPSAVEAPVGLTEHESVPIPTQAAPKDEDVEGTETTAGPVTEALPKQAAESPRQEASAGEAAATTPTTVEVPSDQAQPTTVHAAEPEPISDAAAAASTDTQSRVPAEDDSPAGPTLYTVQIVSNKYNVQNYWTGRWRSEYRIDLGEPTVQGKIQVDVHYFENGNVQLAAKHTPSLELPANPRDSASAIITTISKMEAAYQQDLNATFSDLGDKAFRTLRRALPITRQKVDWEKIGGYKLGGQLGGPKEAAAAR